MRYVNIYGSQLVTQKIWLHAHNGRLTVLRNFSSQNPIGLVGFRNSENSWEVAFFEKVPKHPQKAPFYILHFQLLKPTGYREKNLKLRRGGVEGAKNSL